VDSGLGVDVGLPACGMEAETTAATGDDGDLALEAEDGAEVLELDVDFGRHDDGQWSAGKTRWLDDEELWTKGKTDRVEVSLGEVDYFTER
jgi:hypothetical protein